MREDDWSKEETDHLFALAHEYDLRFVVMADRWDMPNDRSIDVRFALIETDSNSKTYILKLRQDIKSRYYSVCRKLIRNRPAADEQVRSHLMQSMAFDKSEIPLSLILKTTLNVE